MTKFEEFKIFSKNSYSFLQEQYQLSKKELLILLKWSIPLIISNLLNNVSYLFVNLIFVGKQSADQLAGVALSNTWTYCTMSLATGLANAMDTLVSQSFGANNLTLVGLTLQRASIVSSGSFLIVTALWCITEKFLLLVGQGNDVSSFAQQYSLYLLPGLWFYLQTNVLQKYLQCQGVMWPSIVVGFIMNAFNVLFNFLFVGENYGNFSYKGAALATSISRIIAFFLMLAVIKIWKLHEETWFGWKRECLSLQGFKEYLKLGGPASIQHASEAIGFEVLTILAGLLGPAKVPLDAHSVTYNFTQLTYQFPSGISIATSVRVGQLLGSKKESMAKRVSWMAFTIALVFMGIIAIIQYTCRHVIGYIYSDSEDVVQTVARILPIAALFQIFDGGQTIFQGVVRGMGRVITGALCNFIAFYVISIPLSAVFAFPLDKGVEGLWWGLCVGLVSICVILIIIIFRVNWTSEMDKAFERTKSMHLSQVDLEKGIELQVTQDNFANSDGVSTSEGSPTTIKVTSETIVQESYDDDHHHHHNINDKSSNSDKNNNNNSDDDDDEDGDIKSNNSNNKKRRAYNNYRTSSHNQMRTHSNNNFRTNSSNNFRTNSSPDFRSDVPDQSVNRCHPQ
ncbi:hypothetical protein ACTA71_005820 [Dictyostelium dimigraforme]